jgi:hypothetical protein
MWHKIYPLVKILKKIFRKVFALKFRKKSIIASEEKILLHEFKRISFKFDKNQNIEGYNNIK